MEKLYLINGNFYLHMQECDEGWDFTFYDAKTKKAIDGGRLDIEDGKYTVDEAFREITSDIFVVEKKEIDHPQDLIEELQNY